MDLLRRLFGGNASTEPLVPVGMPAMPTRLIRPKRLDAVLEVVGESHRQEALARLAGGRTQDGPMNVDHVAALVAEPTNPYDPNAIAVVVDGSHVGYLSRTDAELWNPVCAWAGARGFLIAAEAALIGGWDRGPADRGSFGIVLHLGTAAETFIELIIEQLELRADHPWQSQLIAFTGDSTFRLDGFAVDREASKLLAQHAGLQVHPRVTKKVQLLVDCDASGVSGNQAKADEYGIAVIGESDFWAALGIPVERISWHEARKPSEPWRTANRSR